MNMTVRHQIATELHRPARRKYLRRSVTLKGLEDLYQADLVEMIPYSKLNKNMRYIMTVINCLTKFAFAVPLKSKSARDIVKGLEPILAKRPMKHFQTDQGKEWLNTPVQNLLRKYNINHYYTFSDLKASIVERLNRTIKTRMYKEFTVRGTYEWLSIIQKLIDDYNGSVHSAIGMKPKDVRKQHVRKILNRLKLSRLRTMSKNKTKLVPKYKINDSVRISKFKKQFTKGYLPNWSNEIFTVFAVKLTQPVTYILQDSRGEILKGGFYEEELSKSNTGQVYLVEKVVRRKNGKVLVRWLGFDKSYDSWIDAKDIIAQNPGGKQGSKPKLVRKRI